MALQHYNLTVNDKHNFEIKPEDVSEMDLIAINEKEFHLIQNTQSYHAQVTGLDKANKTVSLLVNGTKFKVSIADTYDVLVDKMGLSAALLHKISVIKAPMPGLVLNIIVKPGQSIVHGDPLLILEAMKMENVIKSPGEGTVKAIHAIQGKAVEKNEVLIELE